MKEFQGILIISLSQSLLRVDSASETVWWLFKAEIIAVKLVTEKVSEASAIGLPILQRAVAFPFIQIYLSWVAFYNTFPNSQVKQQNDINHAEN